MQININGLAHIIESVVKMNNIGLLLEVADKLSI